MPITRSDFTGLSDTYLDSTAFNLDPAFQNLYLRDPKELDQRRWNGYRYFMDFYKGKQWEEVGEFNPAFGGVNPLNEEFQRRTWNHGKNVIDKLVAFLVKEAFTVTLPPELKDMTEAQDVLDGVWKANSKETFAYDLALMGCITGDAFVKVSYNDSFYADGIGELQFEVLDSRTVLPFFDSMDRRKLVGARIQYPIYQVDDTGQRDKMLYQEVHTESTIVTIINDEVQSVIPNPLGELMIVHIKNDPLPYERFGRSDLEDLILPIKEYNEKISDISEILAYHAAPITIIKGARVQQLEKGARKVWGGIPKDGDVYNLGLNADLMSSLEYLRQLRQFISESSGVPQETLGALQNVSNTSGSALYLQYQPIIDKIRTKQAWYGAGLEKINKLTLMFYEAIGALEYPEDVPPGLRYKTIVKWGNALPRDRSIDLSDISTEMGLGIESKKGALKRLGEEAPDDKLLEIESESIRQADLDYVTSGLMQGIAPGEEQTYEDTGTAAGAEDGPQNDVEGAVAQAKTNPLTQGEQTSVQAVKRSAQTTTGDNTTSG